MTESESVALPFGDSPKYLPLLSDFHIIQNFISFVNRFLLIQSKKMPETLTSALYKFRMPLVFTSLKASHHEREDFIMR